MMTEGLITSDEAFRREKLVFFTKDSKVEISQDYDCILNDPKSEFIKIANSMLSQ